MKNQLLFTLRLLACGAVLLVAGALPGRAQPGSGGPQPGAAPTETPIDGGVSLLVVAGVGLGLKRLRRRREASSNSR